MKHSQRKSIALASSNLTMQKQAPKKKIKKKSAKNWRLVRVRLSAIAFQKWSALAKGVRCSML